MTSKKIWGYFIFGVGCLWLIGGIFGFFQGHLTALLYVFCGMVLLRMGRNLYRSKQ